ncbi:MAG: HAD-IIB family hydrolase [Clostridia bacterium]|nr:HAD-IIB family hydrolase [Clostridia bacterium]
MNNKFKNILVLSDFDGTFAGVNGRMVERNLEAIEYFKSNGGHFTMSSGRLPCMLNIVFPTFREVVNCPLILANGSILYDPKTDNVLSELFYDGVQARIDINDIMSKFDVIHFGCYTDDGSFQGGITPDEAVGDKWRKANLTYSSDDEARRARDYINETYGDRYACFRSSYSFTEIIRSDSGKGTRIPTLRSYFPEKLTVCCIGDFENDIEMLRSADVAFCPSNAIDEVKNICDHVVCHHDEGAIADMIKIIEEQYI